MELATAFRQDLVDRTAFLATGAVVRGHVTIGAEASVWFNAVVRGDTESIRVGAQSNVQDNAVLHADAGFPCQLGQRVTVGHSAVVHGATVEDHCLIGIRAVVLNGARIGAGSLVAAGAVVTEGMQVPPGSVVMGMPASVRRSVNAADQARIRRAAEHYVAAARLWRDATE